MNRKAKSSETTEEFIKIKHRGKIFTPDYLAKQIMDLGHYYGTSILNKHVIDNSCGDGQFLIQIVDRYCTEFLKKSTNIDELKNNLETYIHGIDIDNDELIVCKERCSQVAAIYGIESEISWDFHNEDALDFDIFNGKMDFVIGNPPYVRVHNLHDNFDSVKSFLFANGGMTDLYIAFYEVGIKMLNETGVLSYITPSSFFTSLAGKNMRNYFLGHNLLERVCDLKHFQPFNSTTYTAIITLNKAKSTDSVSYYEYDATNNKPVFVDELQEKDFLINGLFYFSNRNSLNLLKKILNNTKKSDVLIKNGYATLADKIFINDFDFDSKYIIPVIKASRGIQKKIIFPYDENGKLISEKELSKDEKLYEYLLSKKDELLKRSNEKSDSSFWFAFGRSQAINDTFKKKLTINTLIRTSKDLKLICAKSGVGVYSGLYAISDTVDTDTIKCALLDEEFGIYVSLLGKYKSGGYYTFSSKDVKNYLDYKIGTGGLLDVEQ